MSTEIYYFSGTGNSLHIAKEIKQRIPQTDITSIISLLNKENIHVNGETAGFIVSHTPWNDTIPRTRIS